MRNNRLVPHIYSLIYHLLCAKNFKPLEAVTFDSCSFFGSGFLSIEFRHQYQVATKSKFLHGERDHLRNLQVN